MRLQQEFQMQNKVFKKIMKSSQLIEMTSSFETGVTKVFFFFSCNKLKKKKQIQEYSTQVLYIELFSIIFFLLNIYWVFIIKHAALHDYIYLKIYKFSDKIYYIRNANLRNLILYPFLFTNSEILSAERSNNLKNKLF